MAVVFFLKYLFKVYEISFTKNYIYSRRKKIIKLYWLVELFDELSYCTLKILHVVTFCTLLVFISTLW